MEEKYIRKLSHIEKILSIEPIPEADRIFKATLLGWELCVKKDEFKVGDLAVYIECDSVCDITDPRFEFLKETKGRVKIRKFKKQIAMGLALPLSILPPGNYKEGEELTIQAESGDVGVQKNKYGLKEPQMWIFNIINNRTGKHFTLEQMEEFCKKHNLPMVPILDRNFKLPSTVNEMVEYAKGKSVVNKNIEREGVVVRNILENGEKISFKSINQNFLLKYDE